MRAHFLDQRPFLNGTHGGACCGHPSKQVSDAMAKAASAEIAQIVGWNGNEAVGTDDDSDDDEFQYSQFDCNTPRCEHGLVEILNPAHALMMHEL